MKRLIVIALAFVSVIAATELDGKWTGRLFSGEDEHNGAVFMLKQSGSVLTGTAGPSAEKQFAISNGKVDGSVVTFDVVNDDGPVMHFKLTLSEKRLAGDVHGELRGETRDAKIDMTKVE